LFEFVMVNGKEENALFETISTSRSVAAVSATALASASTEDLKTAGVITLGLVTVPSVASVCVI